MTRIGLILKASIIVLVLLALKFLVVDYFGLDVISINPVITAIIAGVIFTIAILFTGTLSDYKESEKIPGELASSIKSLYKDSQIIQISDKEIIANMQMHIKDLVSVLNTNFKNANFWKSSNVNDLVDVIDRDIQIFVANNVAPAIIIKLRNELTNIDKISARIDTIIETSFMPAAYTIAQIAVIMAISVLLFVGLEPYLEGITLFGGVSFLLVSLLILIRDMDNPFSGNVRVDLKIMFKLEKYLMSR
jgi:hypothetical protein